MVNVVIICWFYFSCSGEYCHSIIGILTWHGLGGVRVRIWVSIENLSTPSEYSRQQTVSNTNEIKQL